MLAPLFPGCFLVVSAGMVAVISLLPWPPFFSFFFAYQLSNRASIFYLNARLFNSQTLTRPLPLVDSSLLLIAAHFPLTR